MAIPAVDVSAWIRKESPDYLDLLTKLRQKLASSIDDDVNHLGTPSRDWSRCMQRYQSGYQALVVEERERFKLRLLAGKAGEQFLDDAEYEAGLKQLAVESIGTLSDDELHRELERRALTAPKVKDDEDDD